MSAEWPKLCASFTEDEMKIIQRVQKLLNLNKNQMARRCMVAGIGLILTQRLIQSQKTGLPKVAKLIVKEVFNKRTIRQIDERINKKMAKIDPKIKKEAEEEVQLLHDIMQVFYRHNPVGAPSQKYGKRGKPKDIGL